MIKPSGYSDQLALAICERHADGETIKDICAAEGMPGRRTVYDWLKRHPDFAAAFQQARQDFLANVMHDILRIADETQEVHDMPLAKLKIDARKLLITWLMSSPSARGPNAAPTDTPLSVTINVDPSDEVE